MKSQENIFSLNNQNSQNSENLIDGEIIYINSSGKLKIKGDDLKPINIYGYSVGHVLNDLTATCWFSFLLYYLTDIIAIDKQKAGWVMLSGQIFDGLATPLVGILSDKYNTRFGRRTPWYIGGTLGVVVCFSLIFQQCTLCRNTDNPELWEMVYYITLPSLFNIAWACVQVSHMSLLPSISINRKNRDHMVRLRTAYTFSSQFVCLILSFIIFYLVEDKYLQYSLLSLLCVGIGSLSSLFFLYYCRETDLITNIPTYYNHMKDSIKSLENSNSNNIATSKANIDLQENNHFEIELKTDGKNNENINKENVQLRIKENNNTYENIKDPKIEIYEKNNSQNDGQDKKGNNFNKSENKMTNINDENEFGVLYWLKKPTFYKYIIIYMLVRISINVTSSMLPYYLESILGIKKNLKGGTPIQISLIYLFSTAGCLFNSLYLQKKIEKYNSRIVLMFFSWIFSMIGLLPILFLSPSFNFPIYLLGFLFGIGFALGLSTASSLINDVVGSKGDKAAFVYGAFSLTDKFSCGILLFIFVDCVKDNFLMLKYIIPILPVASLFLALFIIKLKRNKDKDLQKQDQDHECSKSLIENSKFSFISLE